MHHKIISLTVDAVPEYDLRNECVPKYRRTYRHTFRYHIFHLFVVTRAVFRQFRLQRRAEITPPRQNLICSELVSRAKNMDYAAVVSLD